MLSHSAMKISEILYYAVLLMCIFSAIALAIQCVSKFMKDEDVSQIKHEKFHHGGKKNIYPSVSWCIINPFLQNNFENYGDGVNATSYSTFLQGRHWDDRMLNIDYDDVTVSLNNSLNFIWLMLHNDRMYFYNHKRKASNPKRWIPHFYVSFRSAIRKCFTIDIAFLKEALVYDIGMDVKNLIFPKESRQNYYGFDGSNPDAGGGFLVYFHYPGQRFTSYHTIKYNWKPKTNESKPYLMKFSLKNLEVMRRRKTCYEDWKNYDQMIMDRIMLDAGCRPPHWTTNHILNLCSTQEKMKIFKDQPTTTKVESFYPPCSVVQNIHYSYEEKNYRHKGTV